MMVYNSIDLVMTYYFRFLYDLVYEALTLGSTAIDVHNLTDEIKTLRESSTEGLDGILKQYEILNEVYQLEPESTDEALHTDNRGTEHIYRIHIKTHMYT